MNCVRCGTCCITMPVAIRVGDRWKMKPGDVECPYLEKSPEGRVCSVHDEPWYKDTPCFVYGNSYIDPDFFHKRGKDCLVGVLCLKSGVRYARRISCADLEDLGSVEDELL